MSINKLIRMFNLQLFAEGSGDGGTADGTTGETGTAAVSQTMAENTHLANENNENTAESDRNAQYEAFIKEHKDLDDARIQNIVQKRLKGTKETVDKYNALSPTLEMLSKKYGVDASDINALNKAIEEDDSYYEAEALEKGVTINQLKEIRKMERENAELKRQMQEQETRENANKLYARWMNEAEQAKAIYPSFNLEAEMQDPKFVDLLRSNIDVRTAYEVIHKDDIIRGAMQFTADKVESKISKKIQANGARPSENGTSSQSAAVSVSDVSQLSNAEIDAYNRRILRGEKITFGHNK